MAINDVSLTAGMRSNLLSLQSTVDLLNRTQSRLSSGKKVNTAIDNPTSFFASQALTSRASVIDSLKDGMGQAVQTITAADKGIKAITAMIEQAKGIAQAALSAAEGGGLHASETVTLNTLVAGNTIAIGGTTLTAGPSGVATSTSLDNQTITFAANADVGDTVDVGGIAFTAAAASSTAVGTFSLDLNVNTMVAGNTVTLGGVSYTAVASSFTTSYDDVQVDLTGVAEGNTVVVGGVTYTASTGEGGFNFKSDGTDIQAATSLAARITANQGSAYAAASGGTNTVTVTGNSETLHAGSVTTAGGTISATETTSQVDTTVVAPNQFVISGNAGMDAANLTAKINGLQGANYTAAVAGAVITIVGDGATTMDSNSLTLAPAAGIAVSTSITTTANTLGQFEFGVGADANTTAANLTAKLRGYFGSNADATLNTLNAVNASNSNVITITSGTQDLTLTTVEAGTDADDDMTIASSTSTTTSDAFDATHFAVTGDNATDAATLADLINSTAAITNADYTATASGGVLTIVNSEADVEAADVVVVGGTMTEATVAAATELGALQGQYTEMLNQIDTVSADSGYKGKNLLAGNTLTVKFEGDHKLDVVGFDATSTGLQINQAAEWTAAGGDIDADVVKLDNAMNTLRQQSSQMSGNLSIITVRQDFSTNMINTLTEGSDKLTLADANEEGANMLMLQTRQSLSTSALSMSAQAAQSVLRLFQ